MVNCLAKLTNPFLFVKSSLVNVPPLSWRRQREHRFCMECRAPAWCRRNGTKGMTPNAREGNDVRKCLAFARAVLRSR